MPFVKSGREPKPARSVTRTKKALEVVSKDLVPVPGDAGRGAKAWHTKGVPTKKSKAFEMKAENTLQRKAFEAYLEMGEYRNLDAVAKLVGRTLITVQKWSRSFEWVNRCLQWELENQGNLTLESFAENRRKKKFMLQLVDASLKDAAVLDEDGNVKESRIILKSAADVRTFVSLRTEILDEGKRKVEMPGSGGTQNIQNAVFIIRK